MAPRIEALLKLADACEAATGPDRDLDESIMYATSFLIVDNPKPYTASLDAAKSPTVHSAAMRLVQSL